MLSCAPVTVVVSIVAAVFFTFSCAPPEVEPVDAGFLGPYPIDVDPPDGTVDVPIDKVLRISFSDHLDARVVNGSKFDLRSGNIGKWLMAYYNPVTRQAVVWPSGRTWIYSQWSLGIGEGLIGLDGEKVAPTIVTTFRTGEQSNDNLPYRTIDFDSQVGPLFAERCGTCHSGSPDNSVAGLSLDSKQNIEKGTIHVESKGWPGWSLILPSRPGESYLLYKIIGDHRIAGLPMPRTLSDDQEFEPLSLEQQELLADWIAGGAAFLTLSSIANRI